MHMPKLLKRLWDFRQQDTSVPAAEIGGVAGGPDRPVDETPASAGNVIALPVGLDDKWPGAGVQDSLFASPAFASFRFTGLMNAPELIAFFQENYFGLGRHNGAHYRTQEALELGRQSLIAKMQNALTDLAERRRAKMTRLQSEMIAIEGVSPSMSAQLRLACEQLQREMALLQDQIESAAAGKGWVLEALNRYQTGFAKGLREVIDFELLAG